MHGVANKNLKVRNVYPEGARYGGIPNIELYGCIKVTATNVAVGR